MANNGLRHEQRRALVEKFYSWGSRNATRFCIANALFERVLIEPPSEQLHGLIRRFMAGEMLSSAEVRGPSTGKAQGEKT